MTKKAKRFYSVMRSEVKKIYEVDGGWNWTMTEHWGDGETKRTMKDVVRIAMSEMEFAGDMKNEFGVLINKKVIEIAENRIKILEEAGL